MLCIHHPSLITLTLKVIHCGLYHDHINISELPGTLSKPVNMLVLRGVESFWWITQPFSLSKVSAASSVQCWQRKLIKSTAMLNIKFAVWKYENLKKKIRILCWSFYLKTNESNLPLMALRMAKRNKK